MALDVVATIALIYTLLFSVLLVAAQAAVDQVGVAVQRHGGGFGDGASGLPEKRFP